MNGPRLRVVVADDERPARSFLLALLRAMPDVVVVGEAANGAEAVQVIERQRPDLALLDVQMPEIDGLGVVRLLRRRRLPLIIFVTAYDEHAVKAFEMNAVDYLTKPVAEARLREALRRARERLDQHDVAESNRLVRDAVAAYDQTAPALDRLPIRRKNDIVFVPVSLISAIVAEGDLLHVTTLKQERFTITLPLKHLEARLSPDRFIRLSRGVLANIEHIARATPLAGGLYTVTLQNGQELNVSRVQARALRARLLRL